MVLRSYINQINSSYLSCRMACVACLSNLTDTSQFTAAFQNFYKIVIFVIIIYIPYTCLSVCNKLVVCLRYDLFLLLYARHI